jgi:hypothetical protein
MTRELIIEGQHIDLAPDTDITLEYASNLLDEPGKLNLTHSYTIKIPRTLRNARILGMPENPTSTQSLTRQFLSARYYRNGMDLLGPARAYIAKTTAKNYEIILVSQSMAALQALIDSQATLNDLDGLPILTWIGSDGKNPDYGYADFGFAKYQSGLPDDPYPQFNAAPHPYGRFIALLRLILNQAGVPFTFSEGEITDEDLYDTVLLAAPGHKPSDAMEKESGVYADSATLTGNMLIFHDNTVGWDHTIATDYPGTTPAQLAAFYPNGRNFRLKLNIAAQLGLDWSDVQIALVQCKPDPDYQGGLIEVGPVLRWNFQQDENGRYRVFIDEDINPGEWYAFRLKYYLNDGSEFAPAEVPIKYDDSEPLLTVNYIHESIDIAHNNRFPIAGNLPEIEQWAFVKACCALMGMTMIIKDGILQFRTAPDMLDKASAIDWSERLCDKYAEPSEISYSLSGWSQNNTISYEKDDSDLDLPFDAVARLHVEDATITADREFYKLPFAASNASFAIHYEIDGAEAKDIDISPRIFQLSTDPTTGVVCLEFPDTLYGEGLVNRYYKSLQDTLKRPVKMSVSVRLNEVDLKGLDFSTPVYLRQFGKYYAILKVQTSKTDICKVELLQLP